MIADTRALTDKPFNVNVFCHSPAISDSQREMQWLRYLAPFFEEFDAEPPSSLREIYQTFSSDSEMLQVLVDEHPAVVSFHFAAAARPHRSSEEGRCLSDRDSNNGGGGRTNQGSRC